MYLVFHVFKLYTLSYFTYKYLVQLAPAFLYLCVYVSVYLSTVYQNPHIWSSWPRLASDLDPRSGRAPPACFQGCKIIPGYPMVAWFCMVSHGIVWYPIVWCCMLLHCIVWRYMLLHSIAWYSMVLYGTAGSMGLLHCYRIIPMGYNVGNYSSLKQPLITSSYQSTQSV